MIRGEPYPHSVERENAVSTHVQLGNVRNGHQRVNPAAVGRIHAVMCFCASCLVGNSSLGLSAPKGLQNVTHPMRDT